MILDGPPQVSMVPRRGRASAHSRSVDPLSGGAGVRRLSDMAGEMGDGPRIHRSFSIMSPTGGGGNRHQRLLAALLDPAAMPPRPRDDGAPRITRWWEL